MGSRIASQNIKRVSKTEFNSTWDYSARVVEEPDDVGWQYHTEARNVHNGNGAVSQDSPYYGQVISPISTKQVGPNHCINPGWYWPNRYPTSATSGGQPTKAACRGGYWRISGVNIDEWIYIWGTPGEQATRLFQFHEPRPPHITESISNNSITWTIKTNSNLMSDTSEYDRSRTRWYVQRVVEGAYPNITRYDVASFGSKTSGDWEHDASGFKGASSATSDIVITFQEKTVTPDRSVGIRIVAINDGFTGASNPFSTETGFVSYREHIFGKPLKPTIELDRANEKEAVFNVNANWDRWHPVEKMELLYQIGSQLNPSGTWNRAGNEYTIIAGINSARSLTDSRIERIPPTDKAIWYRLSTQHDDSANRGESDILPSTYVAKPSAPTITSCEWQSDHTVQMTVTKNSQMVVDTYVSVTNLSSDRPKDNVEPYVVDIDTSPNFIIRKNGASMHFDPHCVYRITVYNQLVNREGEHSVYAVNGKLNVPLPKSDPATQEVHGSTGAVAKASLGKITITSVTLNKTGRGATITWSATPDKLSITYDDVGTLVEWTDADGGWISTETPKSHKVTDGSNFGGEEDAGEGDEDNPGIVSIDGLTEGTTYQVRLRRYVTLENEDGYGDEATTSITPWSTPTNVMLSAPTYVLPGESVRYTWTFTDEGDTPQSNAILTVNGEPYAVEGSAGSYVVDVPESMEGETLTATVRVACNGGYSEPSAEVTTTVAERPTCTLALPSCETTTDYGGHTLTALPLEVTVGGSGDTFRVRVTSNGGAFSPEPAGGRELAAGEVVATEVYSGAGTYEVDGSMIIGGGNYDVECVCVDTTTGMESDPVTLGFTALWSDAAVIPSGTVEIEDGQAYITPVEGADAPEGESVRIWRKVADGYVLACENAIWGERHLDRVPAYGSDELAYVIEAVSADGDHKWAEVPYTLAGTDARITFGGRTVSLPWNLQPKSSYAKGFERRAHMDGHRAGFWEPGVDRDWALSSGYLRDDRAHTDELREVGRYDGLCYVRGPRGVGFAANVDVDVSLTYDSAEASVDITCAEVADDGTYAIVVEPRDEDAEDEGEGA